MSVKLHSRAGRLAMTGLAGGILASLAMNLQAINLGQDEPGIGAYVSAIVWPTALFVAIEIMLHTPWLKSTRDALTKWMGLLAVASMSAWISYWHGVHVLTAFHYDTASAHSGPLAVDLFMAMSALALNRVGQARRIVTHESASVPREIELEQAMGLTREPDDTVDVWERLSRETADGDAPAPVSPAPYVSSDEPEAVSTKPRAQRGEIHPGLREAVSELIASGATPSAREGVSRATAGRYAKVWRTLRDNPNATIDVSVRPELLDEMRAAARLEVVR